MFRNTFFRRLLFNFAFIFVFLSINFLLFYNVYTSDIITISFAIHPFNICEKYPEICRADDCDDGVYVLLHHG